MNYNILDLLAKANSDTVTLPSSTKCASFGNNTHSMTIVYSEANGKRVTFSKALSEKLALKNAVYLAPLPSEGVLMVAGSPVFGNAMAGNLSGKEKRICYRADIVRTLIELFQLDYSEHVSRSFADISFEDSDGTPIAVIKLSDPISDSLDGGIEG